MSDSNFQWFNIAIVNPDGSETITPMKTWLRQHPDHYPFNPSEKNSRTIARWLIQHGWSHKETPNEFRLYPPDSPPPADLADEDDIRGRSLSHHLTKLTGALVEPELATDSAVVATPEGPPAPFWRGGGFSLWYGHIHTAGPKFLAKKRRRNLRTASRKRGRQHRTNDRFGWHSAGLLPVRGALKSDIRLKAGSGRFGRPTA